jgi:outer membrane protein
MEMSVQYRVVMFVVATLSSTNASAAGLSVDIIPNFVGAGLGVTTEWMGSSDTVAGLVPGGRVKFANNRFAELYGPMGDVNLLDVSNWEFGPMFTYRFGRTDVEDPVVNLLPEIDGGLELGLFGGYHYTSAGSIPWRLRVGVSLTTAVTGDTTGSHVTPYASFWMPVSTKVFLGVGGGFTWSSESFMQQRFGVNSAASMASGLPVYVADAGMRQIYAWPGVIVRLSDHWFGGVGGFYQRLTQDAADSPIITQRGDRNQWTVGVGVGYGW